MKYEDLFRTSSTILLSLAERKEGKETQTEWRGMDD
jgi:hypothetical protein